MKGLKPGALNKKFKMSFIVMVKNQAYSHLPNKRGPQINVQVGTFIQNNIRAGPNNSADGNILQNQINVQVLINMEESKKLHRLLIMYKRKIL